VIQQNEEAGKKWRDATWVAFDTETSGRYPIESEICEIAAVKWTSVGGQPNELESFTSLIKPIKPMSAEVIKIHGITNAMVADAPSLSEVLPKFLKFISGSVLLAHHAQFDLGFVANALEDCSLELPKTPTICTSLLAQGNVPETANHRLQTLVPFFGVDPGQAHRALDDARACLGVALKIFERLQTNSQADLTVNDIAAKMLRRTALDLGLLYFSRFSMNELRKDANLARFIEAARTQTPVQLTYAAGSRPGQARTITPIGVIRQLDGDALVALEAGDKVSKRYWIKDVQLIV
jgi:DNA polymerase-3 subunit epsilon